MSEQLREALSAVVDGEASEFETRRVLDELARDESLSASFESYHLVGAALRGENVARVAEMRARMWQELDADSQDNDAPAEIHALHAPAQANNRSRWLGGIAAAALVAALVTGGGLLTSGPDGDEAATAIAQVEAPSEATAATDPADLALPVDAGDTQLVAAEVGDAIDYGPGFVPNPGLQEEHWRRNEGYYLHHVQQRGLNDANLLPMIKLVSYEQ